MIGHVGQRRHGSQDHIARQIGQHDRPVFGQKPQTRHHVTQFAHIAGPTVGHQRLLHVRAQDQHIAPGISAELAVIVFSDQQDILAPVLERWDFQGHRAQPIEQIATEPSCLDLIQHHPVCQRNDRQRRAVCLAAFFENTQHEWL